LLLHTTVHFQGDGLEAFYARAELGVPPMGVQQGEQVH